MVFQYCSLVLVLGVTATYAGYCARDQTNCCLDKGINQRSCNGSGTSDITDLFGDLYSGKSTICVAGKPNDVYRVWNFIYDLQQGIQAFGRFSGLYAYVFQIPRSTQANCTEYDYYIFETGVCAKVKKIGYDSCGYVAGTSLSYGKLLQIIEFNNHKYFPAPCQMFLGFLEEFTSNENVALNTRSAFSLSGLTAFRYVNFNNKNGYYHNGYVTSLIQKKNYYVTSSGCDGMYYQDGYPHGPQYTCTDPGTSPGVGFYLRQIGFDFSNINGPGQTCLLSQKVGQVAAPIPVPQFNFEILSFVTPRSNSFAIIYVYEQGDVATPTLRGFYSAAC